MFAHRIRELLSVTLLILTAGQAHAGDFYRVELLLFERAGTSPETFSGNATVDLPDHGLPLWVDSDWEAAPADKPVVQNYPMPILQAPRIVALPESGLRLEGIANKLRRTPDYRVLAFTSWFNALPLGYRSVPLVVDLEIGKEPKRAVRGTLTLERRRYLHLSARLHHLQAVQPRFNVSPIPGRSLMFPGVLFGNPLGVSNGSKRTVQRWSTKTWLDELRRMRSGEIHYLDAPTLGIIAYFHPIEPAPDD